MACVGNLSRKNMEREEGEIVDELDDLSDISSEEEYLLRQRLQVLESYNKVLERKKAKRPVTKIVRDTKEKIKDIDDLSEVSPSNLDEVFQPDAEVRIVRQINNATQYKHKKRKEVVNQENINENLLRQKKRSRVKKKVLPKIAISESSEESDQDDKSKRMKLATAISVKKNKTDSSLRSRLMNMICGNKVNKSFTIPEINRNKVDASKELMIKETEYALNAREALKPKVMESDQKKDKSDSVILIEASTDAYKINSTVSEAKDDVTEDVSLCNHLDLGKNCPSSKESDDDLETLRNFALQSKIQKPLESKESSNKSKAEMASEDVNSVIFNPNLEEIKDKQKEDQSDDEDSDTSELRMICLRSTLLKKAIEIKQKQKLRKRLSLSTSLYDEIIAGDLDEVPKEKENNTDTESVDMDIGSDHEKEKEQDPSNNIIEDIDNNKNTLEKKQPHSKSDDLEEDEDLLRANLLTSLSKKLPLLVDVHNLNESVEEFETNEKANIAAKAEERNAPQERRFIINTADTDSEGEHEATKNLTKMHIKLSDTIEFQNKLDSLLKSARLQVESSELPDVVQINKDVTAIPRTPDKFVPKVVEHLPKTEQYEYKSLVKRMAELEKMRQARQVFFNTTSKANSASAKDSSKARNVMFMNNNIDDQIAMSRKKIAEESAKVLKLRDEGFELSRKYEIVSTQLRNLATAITINKKNRKTAQIKLSKMTAQHQILLKRSTTYVKSSPRPLVVNKPYQQAPLVKTHKDNAPLKPKHIQSVKVSVVNDLQKPSFEDFPVRVDVGNNQRTIRVPPQKSPVKTKETRDVNMRIVEKGQLRERKDAEMEVLCAGSDDYESPLQALQSANWCEDPNGVLCPFVVGGSCKDPNCTYLHPKSFPNS